MISKTFKTVVACVLVLAAGGAVVVVRLEDARLRTRIAALHGQSKEAARLRDDNRQRQTLVSRVQADEGDGARVIHADVIRAKGEIAELERKARASYAQLRAQTSKDADELENNREPEKGLVRLEYFQNRGQATPAAAFQTFVWAALKGEDAMLASMIAIDGAAREKGLAVVATLPDAARSKYPTPEKLAALFFAAGLTTQPSAQITEVSLKDAQHAVVVVRGLTDKTQKVPLQLGAQGWQVAVPEKMVEALGKWAVGNSPTVGTSAGSDY